MGEYPFQDPSELENVPNLEEVPIRDGETYVEVFTDSPLQARVCSLEHTGSTDLALSHRKKCVAGHKVQDFASFMLLAARLPLPQRLKSQNLKPVLHAWLPEITQFSVLLHAKYA